MPRIHDRFLDCVVYLYPDRPRAEAVESAGGSGFLVGISLGISPLQERDFFTIVVVTNHHVVYEGGNRTVRVNTRDEVIDIFK